MTETLKTPYVLEVGGEDARQIQDGLSTAVDRAVAYATRIGHLGVLVTQHSSSFYTVVLSPEVPYGQIHERRLTDAVHAEAE